jgi:hypothetical protein
MHRSQSNANLLTGHSGHQLEWSQHSDCSERAEVDGGVLGGAEDGDVLGGAEDGDVSTEHIGQGLHY